MIAADARLETAFSGAFPDRELRFLEAYPQPMYIDDTPLDLWIGLDPTDGSVDCLLRIDIRLSLSDEAADLIGDSGWLAAFRMPADPTAIRVLLANAGYPDGVSVPVHGADWVMLLWNEQLRGSGIELQLAPDRSAGYAWAIFSHIRSSATAERSFLLTSVPVYCMAGSGVRVEPAQGQFPRISRSN